eukprot:TRINITY_DN6033_c0_g1_i2.p1 TRINITY_DN6033_c0_g1~~TRINITY_DN6033_c0_g1_i2.p1  ORF type:complete len:395 (+),score=132.58 TRINITY_DN6033_c0_g1_i2:100-1185(+)
MSRFFQSVFRVARRGALSLSQSKRNVRQLMLASALLGAGSFSLFQHRQTLCEQKVSPQPSVISQGKEHAAYVWIHLSKSADVKEAAKIAAKFNLVVDSVVPPADRDEDTEILAGVGFGPKVWKSVASSAGLPSGGDFDYRARYHPVGSMPATGGDIFFHAKSNSYSSCFEFTRQIVQAFPAGWIERVEDQYGFVYKNGRDLSGWLDGTENPASEDDRFAAALNPNTGSSYMITQRWVHDWETINKTHAKVGEKYVGRTKPDSIELAPGVNPATSHVSRMRDAQGNKIPIVRQSMPYGRIGSDAGLFFIAYANSTSKFDTMLDRMTGETSDKLHDDVMRFTRCVAGTYWYVPSVDELNKISQ